MPQISLYIDRETLTRIEQAASIENVSISRWVGDNIKKSLENVYPKDFESLFGSINDNSFTAPERDSFENDVKRESF